MDALTKVRTPGLLLLEHIRLQYSERTSGLIWWPAFSLQELTIPLKGYVKNFPECQQLHPYEQSLLELTLGPGTYEEVEIYSSQSSVFLLTASDTFLSGQQLVSAGNDLEWQVRCLISYKDHWIFCFRLYNGLTSCVREYLITGRIVLLFALR